MDEGKKGREGGKGWTRGRRGEGGKGWTGEGGWREIRGGRGEGGERIISHATGPLLQYQLVSPGSVE